MIKGWDLLGNGNLWRQKVEIENFENLERISEIISLGNAPLHNSSVCLGNPPLTQLTCKPCREVERGVSSRTQ